MRPHAPDNPPPGDWAWTSSPLPTLVTTPRCTTPSAGSRRTAPPPQSRIAEIDDRKLYLRESYPSLFAFCVHELRLSEDATYRRITAARAARRFPSILVALVEGRVHLAAVLMLAPYLTSANAEELLVAAT